MSQAGPSRPRRPALVLIATILASSLSFVDGSVTNVGLPAIGEALHGDAAGLQWVINAYLLPLSALVLFGGAIGDRFGRDRSFMSGILLFAAASTACAAASSLDELIASRAMQGIGAALLMPNSLAILNDAFEGEARGRAIGMWAAVASATSGLGPVVGGWLLDEIGWRSMFVINLPLAAVALWTIWRAGPASACTRRVPLDPVGAVLATLGLGALTGGLTFGSGPSGWGSVSRAGVVVGAAVLGSFVVWERRQGDRAMVPLRLFASRDFAALTVLTLFLYGALGALVVLLPYGLMKSAGTSATAAGAATLPLTLLLAALSPLCGAWAARLGARTLLAVGCTMIAGGFLLFLRVGFDSRFVADLLPALAMIGLGLAAAVAPLTTAVMSSVEGRVAGTASGFNNAIARTGGLIATACLGRSLASSGESLIGAGHVAAAAAAAASVVAAAAALAVKGGGSGSRARVTSSETGRG